MQYPCVYILPREISSFRDSKNGVRCLGGLSVEIIKWNPPTKVEHGDIMNCEQHSGTEHSERKTNNKSTRGPPTKAGDALRAEGQIPLNGLLCSRTRIPKIL